MYNVRKVTKDYYWIGANDRRLALFEGVYKIPKGVSYNSYVLLDEKTVVFDTVDAVSYTHLVVTSLVESVNRIIEESVPGKQVTIAHVIASPIPSIYESLGIEDVYKRQPCGSRPDDRKDPGR